MLWNYKYSIFYGLLKIHMASNNYSSGSCCFIPFWRPGTPYFVLLDKPLIFLKIKRWKTRISQTPLSAKKQECEQTWKIFLTASTKVLAIHINKLQVNRKAHSPTIQYQSPTDTAIGDKEREMAQGKVYWCMY